MKNDIYWFEPVERLERSNSYSISKPGTNLKPKTKFISLLMILLVSLAACSKETEKPNPWQQIPAASLPYGDAEAYK